ncbi:MAG: nucleoside hydrolase [Halanaerobiaceae bacterium]
MTRMILDVDSVGDDILAIYFAAGREDIELEGVTTVKGASGDIKQATRVALNTLTVADREDVPVYSGAQTAIVGHSEEEEKAPVHFEKTLKKKFGDRLEGFNPSAPEPNRADEDKHAVDFIINKIMNNPDEITLVATGPLTNLGLALIQEPEIAENVKECIIMGGVFEIPGNITPVVEYNIWADPEAAKILFNSGIPLTVVGLDVCENNEFAAGMLTRDDLYDISNMDNPVADKLNDFLPIYIDIWREFFNLVGFPMDDVIAAALAVDKSLCTISDPIYVDVETEGRLTRGQTIPHRGEQIFKFNGKPNTRICTAVDGNRFMRLFKDTIADYSHK